MFGFQAPLRLGTEVWPDQVMIPPVVHVQFESPPQKKKPVYGQVIKGGDGGTQLSVDIEAYLETLPKKEREDLSQQMRQAALDLFMPRFSQWATGLRDNIDRPKIGHIMHKQFADADVVMDYYSHFGASRITMLIRYEAWAKMLGKLPGFDILCMFIYHSGNQISAVPMTALKKKQSQLKRVAHYTQDRNWGSEFVQTTQLRFNRSHSTVLTRVVRDEYNHNYILKNTYHVVGVEAASEKGRHRKDSGIHYEDALVNKDKPAMLVGDSSGFYTLSSKGSVPSNTFVPTVNKLNISLLEGKDPFAVSATGVLYNGLELWLNYSNISGGFGIDVENADTSDLSDSESDRVDEETEAIEQSNNEFHLVAVLTFASDNRAQYDVMYSTHEGGMVKNTMTVPCVKPVHTQTGGLDKCDFQRFSHLVVGTWEENSPYGYGNTTLTWTWDTVTFMVDHTVNGEARQFMWPPATFGKSDVLLKKPDDTIQTDFGQFKDLKPWLLVSDGVDCLFGVIGDDRPYIQHNSEDFSSTLGECIRGSLDEVQTILLDMPLRLLFPTGS